MSEGSNYDYLFKVSNTTEILSDRKRERERRQTKGDGCGFVRRWNRMQHHGGLPIARIKVATSDRAWVGDEKRCGRGLLQEMDDGAARILAIYRGFGLRWDGIEDG